jgi:hypothetical protein
MCCASIGCWSKRARCQPLDHCALSRIRRAEHRVQGRDHRHAQVPDQLQHVAPVLAAEDAELVLKGDDVHLIDLQVVGDAAIIRETLLVDLEALRRRVVVTLRRVVDQHGPAVGAGRPRGEHLAQIGGEGRNAALAGRISADERDARRVALCGGPGHQSLVVHTPVRPGPEPRPANASCGWS